MFKRFRSRKPKDVRRDTNSSDLAPSRADSSFELPPTNLSYRGRSPSPAPSGLGLHVVHQPDFAALDIIFVHGLGGHSQRTWSKNHDPALFWPELWLPFEPDIGTARILTFGYNANFRGASAKSVSGITDFAKELLFEMRFAKDASGADLNIGTNPVMFVVHSMGGLVVKKAFLLGVHDENYKHIVGSISAVIFLSTPHRGTNLAEILNRVLAASFQTSKNFIADLSKSSPAIEELNEQFRHVAPRLSIWSFYETVATQIGPKKIMVLDKDSSVLGYPAEISRPLQADHHEVCKYSSQADPSYISVKNAIKSIVTTFRSKADRVAEENASAKNSVQELFRGIFTSEADYSTLRRAWIPDTCGWFLREPDVVAWINASSESSILWYSAPPASGKSVLSAFMINHIRNLGKACQYFFFKYSDHSKRSVANCFRALAFQLAKDFPEFKRLLSKSSSESLSLDSPDISLLWRNLFEKTMFQMSRANPIYWVFDALDECNAPDQLLECMSSLGNAKFPVRVLILSRGTGPLSLAFDRLSHSMAVSRIEKSGQNHSQEDVELFVEREVKHMRGTDDFKRDLKRDIIARAQGNFLWTKLVIDEVRECHTEESIREVLGDIPDDMTRLYQHMEKTLLSSTRKSNKMLIKTLLEWSICPQRSLTLKELEHALQPEFTGFLDLGRTIRDTCGHFVQVDDAGKVGILHHTAREYFTQTAESEFYVDLRATHARLFTKTLTLLKEPDLRWKLLQTQHSLQQREPFVFYAAVNWSFHLSHCHSSNSEIMDLLVEFFRSPAVLSWIHALALLRRLEVLVKSSKALTSFIRTTRKHNESKNPMQHRLLDLELLEDWAVDLIKVVGKFGRNLTTEPGVIYNILPALSPTKSILNRKRYDADSSIIRIGGRVESSWNDNLGRLALAGNAQALQIACAGKHIAVLGPQGVIHIWDSSNFTEFPTILHGEPVTAMALNENGARLATYGLKSTKIWSIPSGKLLLTAPSPTDSRAKAIVFAERDSKLMMGGDDNTVRHIQIDRFHEGWELLNPSILKETARMEGTIINSPMCLAFNGDNTQVGVSYRGAPLSVWRLSDGRCINRCKRSKDFNKDQRRGSANWFAVDRFTWNPVTGHVLGIYRDGCIFKWHPLTEENVEARWSADEISASPNGKLFATSSSNGSVRVWSFAFFSVIYQLSSEDLVTGIAFSPDSRRFYDIRGGAVNAWESNSITRSFETEEYTSDADSEVVSSTALSKFSEESIGAFEPVTAFAPAPDGSSHCAGYADGNVLLFQGDKSEGSEIAHFYNMLDVSHMRWSKDGRYLAIADLAGDIQILSIRQRVKGGAEISPLPTPQCELEGHNVEDILFSLDSRFLLIFTNPRGFICTVEDGKLQTSSDLDNSYQRKWICHPSLPDVLLAFGVSDVQAYGWEDMSIRGTALYCDLHQGPRSGDTVENQTADFGASRLEQLFINNDDSPTSTSQVTMAMVTQDKEHILLSTKPANLSSNVSKQILIFKISDLKPLDSTETLPSPLPFLQIPKRVLSQVHIPLGILPDSRFVFLDYDLWMCTYSLDTTFGGDAAEYRRFYFIPRDWMGSCSLGNSALAVDGTLFWPKEDRVLRIECDLDEAESMIR
jgi:WD40 repeat protein